MDETDRDALMRMAAFEYVRARHFQAAADALSPLDQDRVPDRLALRFERFNAAA